MPRSSARRSSVRPQSGSGARREAALTLVRGLVCQRNWKPTVALARWMFFRTPPNRVSAKQQRGTRERHTIAPPETRVAAKNAQKSFFFFCVFPSFRPRLFPPSLFVPPFFPFPFFCEKEEGERRLPQKRGRRRKKKFMRSRPNCSNRGAHPSRKKRPKWCVAGLRGLLSLPPPVWTVELTGIYF
jgi:hypothetical protein